MTELYAYTPRIGPPLAVALFMAALGLFSWRRRSVPGAQPFAVACLFAMLWLVGIVAEVAAIDLPAKLTWTKFQAVWSAPAITAMTCFALEYAYPGRWLTRRNLLLLSIPSLLALVLILTNDHHHLIWHESSAEGPFPPLRGIGHSILTGYGLGLVLVNISVFVWLFVRSPQHRWPVALMAFGQVTSRVLYTLDLIAGDAATRPESFILSVAIPFGIYGVALFGFRIFDPLPAARRAAIEQMRDGMVVLDTRWQVLSLNAAAESILGSPSSRMRGKTLSELLPAHPELKTRLSAANPAPIEVALEMDSEARHYAVNLSRLKDDRGIVIGHLLLLHDVTEQRLAQTQLLSQQWAQATLQEREQLAHELHDGLSQSLAFLNLQAQAAQIYLQAGQGEPARANLARLVEVVRAMQGDVRELIGNLLVVSLPSENFCSALRQVSARFEEQTGLGIKLEIEGDAGTVCSPTTLSPATGVQLLRIVQESLANVRKHAGSPRLIYVRLKVEAGQLHLSVEDNGTGFDPALPGAARSHFGLQVMRTRAARIGGEIAVHSTPGHGTRIEVRVPLNSLSAPPYVVHSRPSQQEASRSDKEEEVLHEDSTR